MTEDSVHKCVRITSIFHRFLFVNWILVENKTHKMSVEDSEKEVFLVEKVINKRINKGRVSKYKMKNIFANQYHVFSLTIEFGFFLFLFDRI